MIRERFASAALRGLAVGGVVAAFWTFSLSFVDPRPLARLSLFEAAVILIAGGAYGTAVVVLALVEGRLVGRLRIVRVAGFFLLAFVMGALAFFEGAYTTFVIETGSPLKALAAFDVEYLSRIARIARDLTLLLLPHAAIATSVGAGRAAGLSLLRQSLLVLAVALGAWLPLAIGWPARGEVPVFGALALACGLVCPVAANLADRIVAHVERARRPDGGEPWSDS